MQYIVILISVKGLNPVHVCHVKITIYIGLNWRAVMVFAFTTVGNCFVDNECPLRCNDQNNDLNVSPKVSLTRDLLDPW